MNSHGRHDSNKLKQIDKFVENIPSLKRVELEQKNAK